MLYRFISLVFLGLLCLRVEGAIDFSQILYPLIEEELKRVKWDLDNKKFFIEEEVGSLQAALDKIWESVQREGFSETFGTDRQLRPAYVTMQGVIESAITRALERGVIKNVTLSIISPRMPTPLMLTKGSPLSSLDLSDPQAFAFYRNSILLGYLRAGGVLNTVYAYNAKEALLHQELGLATYSFYCQTYPNLVDSPVIKVDMENFPEAMTGAIYVIDGEVITIESKQVSQANNTIKQKWAIKFGKKAQRRKEQIDVFLKINE